VPFSVAVMPDGEQVTLFLSGDLCLSTGDELDREVRELRRTGFSRIVVDLRGVPFMDVVGLRVLLRLRTDAERDGHELTLRPGPDAVQRIFEMTATQTTFTWSS
jgi:anti-anti-sigma factor